MLEYSTAAPPPLPLFLAAPSPCSLQGGQVGPRWPRPLPGAELGSGTGWLPAAPAPLSSGIISPRGRSRAWLALPWGCRGVGAPRCSPPAVGLGRATKHHREQEQPHGKRGEGRRTLQAQPWDGEGLAPSPPPPKSHSCPLDYRGAEAGEQSVPAYLGHRCERLNELPH